MGSLYQQWALGFLSGVSYADPDHDPLSGEDGVVVTNWLYRATPQKIIAADSKDAPPDRRQVSSINSDPENILVRPVR